MNSEQMRAHVAKLRKLAAGPRKAANEQSSCCHGEDAEEELNDAARDLDRLARDVELIEVDQLRLSLAAGGAG